MQCKTARCRRVVLHVIGYRKILFSTLLLLKTLIKKKYLLSFSVLLFWTEMYCCPLNKAVTNITVRETLQQMFNQISVTS